MGRPSSTHEGHRARRRFGQNFLHDPNTIQRIVDAIYAQPGERLVEIGPGLGALTEPLLKWQGELHVIELDRDLVARLQKRFGEQSGLHIHTGDALKFNFRHLVKEGERLRIVGNLPYNISTPLLFHLLQQLDVVQDIHCMLQKEVVERLAAEPNSKNYGRLSVMIHYFCQVVPLFDVAPEAFTPAPKVNSAVVRLVPHAVPPVVVQDQKLFAQIVTQAFSQRRKTVRNSLKKRFSAEALEALGIDPTARAETLGLDAYAALANAAFENAPASG